jgi:DNA topoisomerase-6 subunit B
LKNPRGWRGTIVDFYLEADYTTSRPKILEYFRNTAIVNPHASITFVDSRGRLYHYPRVVDKVPEPPREAKPHPVGVDVETMTRLIASTKARNLAAFLETSFQKVGRKTALVEGSYGYYSHNFAYHHLKELLDAGWDLRV